MNDIYIYRERERERERLIDRTLKAARRERERKRRRRNGKFACLYVGVSISQSACMSECLYALCRRQWHGQWLCRLRDLHPSMAVEITRPAYTPAHWASVCQTVPSALAVKRVRVCVCGGKGCLSVNERTCARVCACRSCIQAGAVRRYQGPSSTRR